MNKSLIQDTGDIVLTLPTAQEQIQLLKDEFAKYPNYQVNWIENYDKHIAIKLYGATREVTLDNREEVVSKLISALVDSVVKSKVNKVDIILLNDDFPKSYLNYFDNDGTVYLTGMVGTRL